MEVGFTEAQAALLSELVTKDYLREELRRFKREMLLWMLVMQAPVYAGFIVLFMKVGV